MTSHTAHRLANREPHIVNRATQMARLAQREAKPTVYDLAIASAATPVQLRAFDSAVTDVHDRVAEANHDIYGDPLPEHLVQRRGGGDEDAERVHAAAERGTRGAGGKLPHAAQIQQAFGRHDVSDIAAHVGGAATGACDDMGAEAYASGNAVAFRGGPSLHTAAHEAAHIIQQRGGVSLKGGVGAVGDVYERHADRVADLVVQGKSAESLLDQMAGGSGRSGVQRQENDRTKQPAAAPPAQGFYELMETRGIKFPKGMFDGELAPGVGIDLKRLKVLFVPATADTKAQSMFETLAAALSEQLGAGKGVSGSVTVNLPVPGTGKLAFIGLTLSGSIATAANKGYKLSFVGQVQGGVSIEVPLYQLYASAFGNLGVEAEGTVGQLPHLFMAAVWNNGAKVLGALGAGTTAGYFAGKAAQEVARANGGKAKSSRAVGGKFGAELGPEGARANGEIGVTVEGSEELENGKWQAGTSVALAIMIQGITGGAKFSTGDKGDTIEVSLMADKKGLGILGNAGAAGALAVRAQLLKLAGRAPGFAPAGAANQVVGTAARVPPGKVVGDTQVKIECKWERARGGKSWSFTPTISFVALKKYGNENGVGLAASIGAEAKFEGQTQKRAHGVQRHEDGDVHAAAQRGTRGNGGALPHGAAIQQAFGRHDVGGIAAHVGGGATEACNDMGAEAFASGNAVAFRGAPSLHTAAHEAAHIIQQRAGVSLKGGVGEVGDAYERHADRVADLVVQGKSAESLLDEMAGGGSRAGVQRAVQRMPQVIDGGGSSGYTPKANTDMPDATRIALWEEFISHNFSPVSQALVRHFMHGKGALYTPTKSEMQQILRVSGVSSDVTITRIANWNKLSSDLMTRAKKGGGKPLTLPIQNSVIQAEQCAPNTLGGFKVTFNGKVISTGANWNYVGTITLYDEWDFDIAMKSLDAFMKQAKTRGAAGQAKTLIGAGALPGKSFKFLGKGNWSEGSATIGKIF